MAAHMIAIFGHAPTQVKRMSLLFQSFYLVQWFALDLLSYDWQPFYTSTTVNNAWGCCKNIFKKSINHHALLVKKGLREETSPVAIYH